MESSPQKTVVSSDIEALVGQAWSQHYHGQNEDAIRAFRQIVEKYPEHIDANYGLALSLKAVGKTQEAKEIFQKTKTLAQASAATEVEDNSRFIMIVRMIDQQLARL